MPQPRPIKIIISGVDKTGVAFREAIKGMENIGGKIEKINAGLGGLLGGTALATTGLKLGESLGLKELPATLIESERGIVRLGNRFPQLIGKTDLVRKTLHNIVMQTGEARTELEKGVPPLLAQGSGFDVSNFGAPLLLAGQLAKAYQSNVLDATMAERAMVTEMQVAPGEVRKSFGAMAIGTENTTIAMSDLIAQFPQLAKNASLIGIVGQKGVAQVAALLGTVSQFSNGTDDAVEQTQSLLEKIVSKRALSQFQKLKEAGVADFFTPIFKAQSEGRDVLEEFANTFNKITKGRTTAEKTALVNALGLKGNAQVILGLIAHMDEYRKRRDSNAAADSKVNADYARAINNLSDQWEIFQSKVSETVTPGMTAGFEHLNALLTHFSKLAYAPEIALGTVAATTIAGVGALVLFAAKKLKLVTDALKVVADMGKTPAAKAAADAAKVMSTPEAEKVFAEGDAARSARMARNAARIERSMRFSRMLGSGRGFGGALAKGVGAAVSLPADILLYPAGLSADDMMFDPKTKKSLIQSQMERSGINVPSDSMSGSATINIKFENAPPGMRVRTSQVGVPGLSVDYGTAGTLVH